MNKPNEWEDEEKLCPEGFSEEEDCGAPWRFGIETCEFLCPFRRLNYLLELESCYYCGKSIEKGTIICHKCTSKELLEEF